MNYLPYIAGAAALGLAARGRRAVPARSYHLSANKFDRFTQQQAQSSKKQTDLGWHFGSKQTAFTAANKLYREGRVEPGDTVYLYEVALDTRRPLVLAEGRMGSWSASDIVQRIFDGEYEEEELIRMGFTVEDIYGYDDDDGPISPSGENLKDLSWDPRQEQSETVDWLESRGYDSIEYENTFEGGGFSHIVFRPQQVRILNVTPHIVPAYAGAASRRARRSRR
tara:strand:+ start:1696 stop:2367 length:672 start_codon:yes stop_codon:yes gene_type:complete